MTTPTFFYLGLPNSNMKPTLLNMCGLPFVVQACDESQYHTFLIPCILYITSVWGQNVNGCQFPASQLHRLSFVHVLYARCESFGMHVMYARCECVWMHVLRVSLSFFWIDIMVLNWKGQLPPSQTPLPIAVQLFLARHSPPTICGSTWPEIILYGTHTNLFYHIQPTDCSSTFYQPVLRFSTTSCWHHICKWGRLDITWCIPTTRPTF